MFSSSAASIRIPVGVPANSGWPCVTTTLFCGVIAIQVSTCVSFASPMSTKSAGVRLANGVLPVAAEAAGATARPATTAPLPFRNVLRESSFITCLPSPSPRRPA